MKNKNAWITVCIVNLAIVAFLGFSLRTKFLFPIGIVDYRNLISTHSHFAFGGWVTLVLMVLLIDNFLPAAQQSKKIYAVILWGILLNSYGMLISFPIQGYGLFAIVFSTLFIFFTYAFSWIFITHVWRNQLFKTSRLLVTCSLLSLVISSIGPFWLANMMATHSGSAVDMRDAVYTYLHFQYNGFFTLSVFALLFHRKIAGVSAAARQKIQQFAIVLCLSIAPSLFLSLLWHYYNFYLRAVAFIGCGLILLTVVLFFRIPHKKESAFNHQHKLPALLLNLSIASFVIKMILQTGTVVPWLGHAVFGYRPIIIGFLHLVFLGLVTFYVLSYFLEKGILSLRSGFTRFAVVYFTAAVIFNETILLVDGVGRLFKTTNPIYDRLLWIASIGLFSGAILLNIARIRSNRILNPIRYSEHKDIAV